MNKPKRNRRNYIVKPKVGKKLIISTAASVMAVSVAASLLWNAMKVSVPVEANTLSGVSEALKDHGSGEVFVILDIVPGTTDGELPLGTIGYLTSGQSPIEQGLEDIFSADAESYRYDVRHNKAKALGAPYAGFNYEERLTGGNGWTQINDGTPFVGDVFTDEDADTLFRSIVKGTVTPMDGGEYKLISSLEVQQTMMVPAENTTFSLSNEPRYEGFKPSDETVVYIDDDYSEDDSTHIYSLEDGEYKYSGTIGDVVTRMNARKQYDEDLIIYEEKHAEYEEIIKQYEKELEEYKENLKEWEQQYGQQQEQQPESEQQGDEEGEPVSVVSLGWMKFSSEELGEPEVIADEGEAGDVIVSNDNNENQTGNQSNGGQSGDNQGGTTGGDNQSETTDGDKQDGTTGGDNQSETTDGDNPGGTPGGDNQSETTDGNNPEGTPGGDNQSETTDGNNPEGTPGGDNQSETTDGNNPGGTPGGDNQSETTGGDNHGETIDGDTLDDENQDGDTSGDETGDEENDNDIPARPTEPKKPDIEEPLEPEELPEELNDENYEYYIVKFEEYVRVDKDEEPIEGLYIPEDYDTVPYEESSMFAIATYADEESVEESIEASVTDESRILVYVGSGNGDCTITMGENQLLVYNAPTYFRCFAEDLLKEYVFCNSGLNIQINVMSAAKVTANDVNNADLIYLEDVSREDVQYINGDSDIDESAMLSIIHRAANDLMPVIVDYQVSQGGAYNNNYLGLNYQKLASILLVPDLYEFYQDMDGIIVDMCTNFDADKYKYGSKDNGDHHYVNSNIYVVNSASVNVDISNRETFTEEFGDISGFEEVKAAIDAENKQFGSELSGPSKAMAIQYIINYANGFVGEFDDLTILELQPTADINDLNSDSNNSKNNTVLFWKKTGSGSSGSGQQILRSNKLIRIGIVPESVAQFSGEQIDINDKYQMIFIGLDGYGLNHEGKETAYNDSSMNGTIYSGMGDIADGGEQRYDGIDITPQKKNALLDFMLAGYPIVVENNFFKNKTAKDASVDDINTDYVDESSQMYDFLKIVLSDQYNDYIYTIADTHTERYELAAQLNGRRLSIEFDRDNAISEVNDNVIYDDQIIQTITENDEGRYIGYIPYKVDAEGMGDVEPHFYLDMNQDGRFDDSEEVMGAVISGGVLMIEFPTPERGSIPWKLEVCSSNNRYRRTSLTGYFKFEQSVQMPILPIRVVQVVSGTVETSMDAKFNLELAYDYDNGAGLKSLLGYYLKYAEDKTRTKLEIKTITIGQLAAELKDNEKYLSTADVLVLGFGPDEVPYNLNYPVENKEKDVAGYVNEYISEGRGVLVSSAASSEAMGRMQLKALDLGQKETKTYSSLGRVSGERFYKYNALKGSMFGDWSSLSASKVNDGAISHYPYEIGPDIKLGGNTVNIADYLLDLESNGASDGTPDVTAWYCLGDSSFSDTKTSYGVSPKDAANNYYVYSKGNVVYIGSTGYSYKYDSTGSADISSEIEGTDDCMLFVNALMEAYTVGIKSPRVTIVAGFAEGAAEIDSICIPYDEQIGEENPENPLNEGVLDDTVNVYFKISEPNLAFKNDTDSAFNKDVEIRFYYEDKVYGGSVNFGGGTDNVTEDAPRYTEYTKEEINEIWTVEQNQLVQVNVDSGADLVPGQVYMIKAPVKALKGREYDSSVKADIYIVVQSHFKKLGKERDPIGSDFVTLNRAQLFLLE